MQTVCHTYWDAGKGNLTAQNTRKPFGGHGSAPDPALPQTHSWWGWAGCRLPKNRIPRIPRSRPCGPRLSYPHSKISSDAVVSNQPNNTVRGLPQPFFPWICPSNVVFNNKSCLKMWKNICLHCPLIHFVRHTVPVAVLTCRRFSLSPFWSGQSVAVLVSPFWRVAVLVCRRFDHTPTYPSLCRLLWECPLFLFLSQLGRGQNTEHCEC